MGRANLKAGVDVLLRLFDCTVIPGNAPSFALKQMGIVINM